MESHTAEPSFILPPKAESKALPTPARGYPLPRPKHTSSETTTPTTPPIIKTDVIETNPVTEAQVPIKKPMMTMTELTQRDAIPTNNFIPLIYANTDEKIVKYEVRCADVYDALIRDPSLSKLHLKQLSAYSKLKMKHLKPTNAVPYNFAKGGFAKHKFGRLYAERGIQAFPSYIRGVLLEPDYFEWDFKNCHYIIIAWYAKSKGVDTTALYQYINNRDEEMSKVSNNKTVAKTAFLKILYGGSIEILNEFRGDSQEYSDVTPEGDTTLLQSIKKTVDVLKELCWAENEDKQYLIPKNKRDRKISMLGHFLQDKERQCLMAMDTYLKTRGRAIEILIHDAGMLRKLPGEKESPDELRQETEEAIYDAVGIRQTIVCKELPKYVFKTKQREYVGTDENGELIVVNATYATKHLIKLMNGKVIVDKSKNYCIMVFNDTNGMWESGERALSTEITRQGNNLMLYQNINGKDVLCFDGGTTKGKRDILDRIVDIPEIQQDFDNGEDTSKYKLLFSDGIYDSKNRIFTPGFDSSIIFYGKIPRACPKYLYTDFDDSDECIEFQRLNNYVNQVIFTDPYTKDQIDAGINEFLKVGYARAIQGEVEAKRVYFIVGETNTCKSVQTEAIGYSFGTFIGTFLMEELYVNKNNSDDISKKLGWLKDDTTHNNIYRQRITIANEADATRTINGSLLASISSGGTDAIQVRGMGKDRTIIKVGTTFFMFSND